MHVDESVMSEVLELGFDWEKMLDNIGNEMVDAVLASGHSCILK